MTSVSTLSTIQASTSALLVTAPQEAQTVFGQNPFNFWALVVGTFSTVFGTIIAVLVFILGLQIWQQYKLREQAEKEYEEILKIKNAIAKTAKDMSGLRVEQQRLFNEISVSMEKQAKELVGEATNAVGLIKSLASTSKEQKQKIESISKEIERKSEYLRGSAISLGTISSIGTFSPSMSPSAAAEYSFLKVGTSPTRLSEYEIGNKPN